MALNFKPTASNIILILANLVPLAGVLFLGWDGKSVFVIYIIETIIVGILNAIKMLTVYLLNGAKKEPKQQGNVGGFWLIPFFLFHYFFFIFVQSVLFFAFSSIWQPHNSPEPFNIFANFALYINKDTQLALFSLLFANLTYFTEDFIVQGKYRTETMTGLMMQPYKRIILQQFVVILGGFIFMLTGGIKLVVGLFTLLKIMADYISANYKNMPALKKWVIEKAQNDEKELSETGREQIERIFGK